MGEWYALRGGAATRGHSRTRKRDYAAAKKITMHLPL